MSRAQHQELGDLREIEAGVSDHRRENRAPREEDGAPERAEAGGGERHVMPLLEMPEAEEDAEDRETHQADAAILLEPPQHEAALDLLTQAAGDHDDECEDDGVGA